MWLWNTLDLVEHLALVFFIFNLFLLFVKVNVIICILTDKKTLVQDQQHVLSQVFSECGGTSSFFLRLASSLTGSGMGMSRGAFRDARSSQVKDVWQQAQHLIIQPNISSWRPL